MKIKQIKYFAAALTTLAFITPLAFAAGDTKIPAFEKDTWQQVIVKKTLTLLKEQEPLIKKEEELKKALAEEEKQPFSFERFHKKQKQQKPTKNQRTLSQIQMERELALSVSMEEVYNRPSRIEEGKKIASVYSDIKQALNRNELFRYYHLDKNSFSDFSQLTPDGVSFIKDVFQSIQEGRPSSVKPYRAELYKSGAVLVYFKGIKGEPSNITFEFYPSQMIVVIIVGDRNRFYAELETLSKDLKI